MGVHSIKSATAAAKKFKVTREAGEEKRRRRTLGVDKDIAVIMLKLVVDASFSEFVGQVAITV